MNPVSRPGRLAALLACFASSVAGAEARRWWTEIPDKALFLVGLNLSHAQPSGTAIAGTLLPTDIDGEVALVAAKSVYTTITVPQPDLP